METEYTSLTVALDTVGELWAELFRIPSSPSGSQPSSRPARNAPTALLQNTSNLTLVADRSPTVLEVLTSALFAVSF
jgi:hypothetical protein